MRIYHGLLLICLALVSRVGGETPQSVVATIPSEVVPQNVAGEESAVAGLPMTGLEVTGYITKSGDIFELPEARSLGAIESRQEPNLEEGMTMCRYGNIVVYSNTGCDSFFSPSDIENQNTNVENPTESELDSEVAKPAKKKKKKNKVKRNKRKQNRRRNKNKKRNNKNRQQLQRKKALKKKKLNQKRRQTNLKNGGKRGNNSQRKNKKRINNNNSINKRRRINEEQEEQRSDIPEVPLLYTILLNRH